MKYIYKKILLLHLFIFCIFYQQTLLAEKNFVITIQYNSDELSSDAENYLNKLSNVGAVNYLKSEKTVIIHTNHSIDKNILKGKLTKLNIPFTNIDIKAIEETNTSTNPISDDSQKSTSMQQEILDKAEKSKQKNKPVSTERYKRF